MKQRDPFFDNAKILLMVLVVLGHVLPIGFKQKINVATFEWIFSFHMPLFVFISGYFTKITNSKKFWEGIIKLVETLIVFTIVHVVMKYMQGEAKDLFRLLVIPQFTLWYLLSLIWWRIMLYYIPSSIRENQKKLIIYSIIFCLLMGWVPIDDELSFQRTFSFFPFFVTGFMVKQNEVHLKSNKRRLFHFFFLLAMAMLYFFIPVSFNVPLFQHLSYLHSSYSPLFYFVFRIGWLILASCMLYCFLSIVPRKNYRWTRFGQLTLFIYMYHAVILSWRYILRDTFHLPTSFLHCILYTGIVLVAIWLMSKIKFFHWLLNPISSTISIFKTR